MTDVTVLGQIRGNARQYFSSPGVNTQPVMSDGGALVVAQELPERAELVKLGKSYGAAIPTGSAFTYVNAWPTTRAELILANAEGTGGPSYSVDRVWLADITAGPTGPRG